MLKNLRLWIFLCVCAQAFHLTAYASTFVSTTEDDFIRQAELICAFEVKDTESIFVQDQIFTEAKIEKILCPKGLFQDSVNLRWPGGAKKFINPYGIEESLTTSVPGLPSIKKGQFVLAALKLESLEDKKIYFIDQWSHIRFLKKAPQDDFIILDSAENSQFFNIHKKSTRSPRSKNQEQKLSDFAKKLGLQLERD